MSSDTLADVDKIRLVNERRLKEYDDARDVSLKVEGVRKWNDRFIFSYWTLTDEQTCSCGNIFHRRMSCELCAGKCLGVDYEREINMECGSVNCCCEECFNNDGCCECDVCFLSPDMFKLPYPIPVAVSCLSSCSCK
jgi:hypothetical protein